jgi:hypothetical protein
VDTDTYEILNDATPPVIHIHKVDENGNPIQDVTFQVIWYDGTPGGTYIVGGSSNPTDANGNTDIILDNTYYGELIITEVTPPSQYQTAAVLVHIFPEYGLIFSGAVPESPQRVYNMVNALKGEAIFKKVDQWGEDLDGAEFELQTPTKGTYNAVSVNGVVSFPSLGDDAYFFATLTETKAPNGYVATAPVRLSFFYGYISYIDASRVFAGTYMVNRYDPAAEVLVTGRTLDMNRTGDTADWIEIARTYDGKFSLIVRTKPITNGLHTTFIYSNDVTDNRYEDSVVRKELNDWYIGTNYYKDPLPVNARLRLFAVGSDAIFNHGSYADAAAGTPTDGASIPEPIYEYQKDTVFLLSAEEARRFISYRINSITSAANARANFDKLDMSGDPDNASSDFWLRSEGNTADLATAMTKGDPNDLATYPAGVIYQANTGISRHIYPAVWVKQGIF